MKKSKRFLSLALSATLCVSSASTLSANAFDETITDRTGKFAEFTENITLVDDHGLWERFVYSGSYWDDRECPPYDVYAREGKQSFWLVEHWGMEITLEAPSSVTDSEIDDILNKHLPVYSFYRTESATPGHSLWRVRIKYFDDVPQDIYKEMAAELKENVPVTICRYSDYLLRRDLSHCDLTKYSVNNYDALLKCIEENNISCTVIDNRKTGSIPNEVSIIPDDDLSLDELFAFAAFIKEETGSGPCGIGTCLAYEPLSSFSVDLLNALDGDSNEDSDLSIADSVYIMQSIANPDKYQLTAQGRFNADIADTGDGITLKDALAIQQKLLSINE